MRLTSVEVEQRLYQKKESYQLKQFPLPIVMNGCNFVLFCFVFFVFSNGPFAVKALV